jgi:UDP:flavonoid glycosyltransferase YjiC (YdhE family)
MNGIPPPNRYGIIVSVNEALLKRLCNELRDATDEQSVRRAAEALRAYLKKEQILVRERLASYAEKAFSSDRN